MGGFARPAIRVSERAQERNECRFDDRKVEECYFIKSASTTTEGLGS